MLKPSEKEISGIIYCINQMDSYRATKNFFLLSKHIGEPISNFFKVNSVNIQDMTAEQEENILSEVIKCLKNLDADAVTNLIQEMLSHGIAEKMEGKIKPVTMSNFTGRLDEMFKLVIAVIEVNYKDFFTNLMSGAKAKG